MNDKSRTLDTAHVHKRYIITCNPLHHILPLLMMYPESWVAAVRIAVTAGTVIPGEVAVVAATRAVAVSAGAVVVSAGAVVARVAHSVTNKS